MRGIYRWEEKIFAKNIANPLRPTAILMVGDVFYNFFYRKFSITSLQLLPQNRTEPCPVPRPCAGPGLARLRRADASRQPNPLATSKYQPSGSYSCDTSFVFSSSCLFCFFFNFWEKCSWAYKITFSTIIRKETPNLDEINSF